MGVDLWPKRVVLLSLCAWYSNVMNDLFADVKLSLGSELRAHIASNIVSHNVLKSPVPQGCLICQMGGGNQ